MQRARTFGGEFESRLLFALGQHIITPFLRTISDTADLERLMHAYVKFQTDETDEENFFHESSSESRAGLEARIERLDAVRKELEALRTSA